MGRTELLAPIWNWRKNLGQMIAPETAALPAAQSFLFITASRFSANATQRAGVQP